MSLILTDFFHTVTQKTQYKKEIFLSCNSDRNTVSQKCPIQARAKNSTTAQFHQPSSKLLHIGKKWKDRESALHSGSLWDVIHLQSMECASAARSNGKHAASLNVVPR